MPDDRSIAAAPGVLDGLSERGEARLNSKSCEPSDAGPLHSPWQTAEDGPMSEGKASVPGQMSEANPKPADPRKSWRDILPIHSAAELFPLMVPEELRVLGADIKANRMCSPIVVSYPGPTVEINPRWGI